MKKLVIELHDFDAVTFYNIVDQLKDQLKGINPSWDNEYSKVMHKVEAQIKEQMGFK